VTARPAGARGVLDRVADFARALARDRRTLATLALAVAINLLALALYLWSRGGQTTHIRVEQRGDLVAVFVDGRKQLERRVIAPEAGGLTLVLTDTDDLPTLPRPRALDRVRVSDLDSGDVLFEDGFDHGPSDAWATVDGTLVAGNGVAGSHHGKLTLDTGPRDWRDVRVDVSVRNVMALTVMTRAAGGRGAVTTVRTFWWNDDAARTVSVASGGPNALGIGQKVRLSRAESLRSLAAMLLRPYPYLLALLAAGVVAVALVPRTWQARAAEPGRRALALVPLALPVAVLAYLTGAVLLRQAYVDRSHFPYVPDSLAYVFQAKIFASGHLTAPRPAVPEAFTFFDPAPFVLRSSSWAAQFPFGHPLVLVPGVWIGAIWLVPPLLAVASVALIARVGWRLYGPRVALLAALLLATSPFFLMNVNDVMSHNTALFYLLVSLALLLERRRWPALTGLLAGVFFGLLFNTRPLAAVALVPAFGLLLLGPALDRARRRDTALHVAGFAVGGLALFGAFLLYNHATTGAWLRTGYQATGVTFFERPTFLPDNQPAPGLGSALGAGGSHDSSVGIANERVQLGLLLLVLHGWPAYIGLGFVLLPFLLGTRHRYDWWLLLAAASTTGVWVLFESTGVMHGPRYWFEALPFLLLLAARGAERAADALASVVASLRGRRPLAAGDPALTFAARVLVFAFVLALVGSSIYTWLLGRKTTWRADFVPPTLTATCCALELDDRIAQLAERQQLHNALVLVKPCETFVCYGSVFWRNTPTLDGDIVWAKDVPEKRAEIVALYPGRATYLATYDPPTLVPLAASSVTPAAAGSSR
jgi:4-amino-4-deoxy-L-arabinose transferase-like glycosyltransferase